MARPDVVVVDYGAGNLRSVEKALIRSEIAARVSSDPAAVRDADSVVLPGVGAFADGMKNLVDSGLADAVKESIAAGRPYLGLCLGLQLLFEEGHEHGITKGLGTFSGRVERFPDRAPDGSILRVPHIGWNEVVFSGAHPMLDHMPERDHYYFVHSYRPVACDPKVVVGRAEYGEAFAAAAGADNVFAVQFHPEKSQSAGKRLLDAYRKWLRAS